MNLLDAFEALKASRTPVNPHRGWVVSTRQQLLRKISKDLQAPKVPSRISAWQQFIWSLLRASLFRPATAVFALVVFLGSSGYASVTAASQSVPGDRLYRMKLVAERARLALAPSVNDHVKLRAEFTARRVDELKAAVSREDSRSVQTAAEFLREDLRDLQMQLSNAATELSPAKAAAVATMVDRQSEQAFRAVNESKPQAIHSNPGSQKSLEAVQWFAAANRVNAIEVLAAKRQESKDSVSVEQVAEAIKSHMESVAESSATTSVSFLNGSSTVAIPTTTSTTSSTSVLPILQGVETLTATGTMVSVTTTEALLPQMIAQMKDVTDQMLPKPEDVTLPSAPASSDAKGQTEHLVPVDEATSTIPIPPTEATSTPQS